MVSLNLNQILRRFVFFFIIGNINKNNKNTKKIRHSEENIGQIEEKKQVSLDLFILAPKPTCNIALYLRIYLKPKA